jgi:hypothetical protein
MVSIFITDAFIGEEVNPEKKHHQAYTPMGEKKPGVVYKRKYRKAEDPTYCDTITGRILHHLQNYRRPPRKYASIADAPP